MPTFPKSFISQCLPPDSLSDSGDEESFQYVPSRPEILSMEPDRLVWREIQHPQPGTALRPVIWDIQLAGKDLELRADLKEEGEIEPVDFREVRCRLNGALQTDHALMGSRMMLMAQLRESLMWQRNPDIDHSHMLPPEYQDNGYWTFSVRRLLDGEDLQNHPTDIDALRPATDAMMAERREVRQWVIYGWRMCDWAAHLKLNDFISIPFEACRARIFQYSTIPECRELFASSGAFTLAFGIPGMVPELDNLNDEDWRGTAANLARLNRREWMERLGLPPTRQIVRLFERLDLHVIPEDFDLVRKVFADPDATKLLSYTECMITKDLLQYFLVKPHPMRWSTVQELCHGRRRPHWQLGSAIGHLDFFNDDAFFSERIQRLYRRAKGQEQVEKANRISRALRIYWNGMIRQEDRKALGNTLPPLQGTDTIKHLNRPQDIAEISHKHELCLGDYVGRIISGEYALYQIELNEEFAVAGIEKNQLGEWCVEQTRGTQNRKPSKDLSEHFEEWMCAQL